MSANGAGPRPANTVEGKLARQLEDFLIQIGLGLALTGDEFSANVVATKAPEVAAAWARLAAKNPRVRQVLEAMMTASDWSTAVSATLGLVLPIAAHHGVLPARFMMFGGVPESPEVAAAGGAPAGPIPPADPIPPGGPIISPAPSDDDTDAAG